MRVCRQPPASSAIRHALLHVLCLARHRTAAAFDDADAADAP